MSGKGAKGLSGKGAKGTMGDKKLGDKRKPTSRSAKAGLQFPVGRIHRLLKVCPLLVRRCLSNGRQVTAGLLNAFAFLSHRAV